MKISTKGRYALRLLYDIAGHQADGCVSLKEVSERQDISKKYLEQIVPMLTKPGILRTVRGNQGGYMLAVSPDTLTVGEILKATEGNLAPVPCLEFKDNDCPKADFCPTLYIWQGLQKTVTDYFESITLQDIIDHNSDGNDYSI